MAYSITETGHNHIAADFHNMKLRKRDIYTDRCCLRQIAIIAASVDWKAPSLQPHPTSDTIFPTPADAPASNNSVLQLPPSNPAIRYFTVKTFHMEPRSSGDQLYMSYDPLTGVRTAAILGLFMLTVMGYILYKSKFSQAQWTSKDRLFIEIYKKKLHERRHRRPDIRTAVKELMLRPDFSLVPDLTATWVKSHRTIDADGAPSAASGAQSVQTTNTSRDVSGCLNGTVEVQAIPPPGTLHMTLQAQGAAVPRLELVTSQNLHVIKTEGMKRHSIPSIVLRDGPLHYDTRPAAVTFSRISSDIKFDALHLHQATDL